MDILKKYFKSFKHQYIRYIPTSICLSNVYSYLRPGGYPIVISDGGSFPENMKVFGDMVSHNLTFDPLEGRANLIINSPLPDDWFMLAHTNPRNREMDFVQRVGIR